MYPLDEITEQFGQNFMFQTFYRSCNAYEKSQGRQNTRAVEEYDTIQDLHGICFKVNVTILIMLLLSNLTFAQLSKW